MHATGQFPLFQAARGLILPAAQCPPRPVQGAITIQPTNIYHHRLRPLVADKALAGLRAPCHLDAANEAGEHGLARRLLQW